MPNLSKVEDRIIRTVARNILRAGYRITVNDGEEDALVNGLRLEEVMAEVGHTDQTRFDIFSRDKTVYHGFVWFVHGNEEDVVSDSSANEVVDALLEGAY